MNGAESLRFYFDFSSPYAYLAWTQIHALADRYDLIVEPVPVTAASVVEAGGQGHAETPQKRVYVVKDSLRLARRFGVPLTPARAFDSQLALAAASLPMSDDARERLIDALFEAAWAGGGGLDSAEAVAAAAARAGFDGEALVQAASTAEARERVQQQTGEAIVAGAFGVPSIVVDGELFFGVESLSHLETFLEGRDLVAALDVSLWARPPAAA